jgi:hypothetical protein
VTEHNLAFKHLTKKRRLDLEINHSIYSETKGYFRPFLMILTSQIVAIPINLLTKDKTQPLI